MEKNLIDIMGGPTKVAQLLGIVNEKGAIQRISNWKKRGIPAQVMLTHSKIFAKYKKQRSGD